MCRAAVAAKQQGAPHALHPAGAHEPPFKRCHPSPAPAASPTSAALHSTTPSPVLAAKKGVPFNRVVEGPHPTRTSSCSPPQRMPFSTSPLAASSMLRSSTKPKRLCGLMKAAVTAGPGPPPGARALARAMAASNTCRGRSGGRSSIG